MLREPGDEGVPVLGGGDVVRTQFAVQMYVRHMRPIYRPATIRGRRKTLEKFTRDLDNPALKAVKARHITDWLAAQSCGPSSVRTLLSHLRCFFTWTIEHGHLKASPVLLIKSPKQPRAVPRSLSLNDMIRLREVLPDERAFLICGLMVDLGLRRGEVARLDVADLDRRAGTIRIDGKGGHQRLLPITPMIDLYVGEYMAVRGRGAGPLIRSQISPFGGLAAETIGAMVSRWLRDAGVKQAGWDGRSAHALRHSCAENLYRHGVELRTIAAALGHASPTTTWIYLRSHQSVEDLRKVMGQQYVDSPVLGEPFELPRQLKHPRSKPGRPWPAYQIGAVR